jgi:hypothetical protein
MRRLSWGLLFLLVLVPASFTADPPAKPTARAALMPFNDLIGAWRGLGTPEGNLQEKRKGLWQETIRWEWQFQKNDAWLKVSFDKGKHFRTGTLRYLADKKQYQLMLTTAEQQEVAFIGSWKDHRLIVERQDEKTKEQQRVVISLVSDNRFVYHYEIQPPNRTLARKVYLVGATKEGKPLVAVGKDTGPFCVVSYGPPNSEVRYKGKTYYVCCSSCRQEFLAQPDKYIKEYEEMLAKRAQEQPKSGKKP